MGTIIRFIPALLTQLWLVNKDRNRKRESDRIMDELKQLN